MAELTYRLFMVATVGMLAGTVFLLASSREVDPKTQKRSLYLRSCDRNSLVSLQQNDWLMGWWRF